MTVCDFAKENALNVITMPEPNREIKGCYMGDLLSWVMGRAEEGDAWITIMSNANTVAVASLTGVACVILAEDVNLDSDVIKTAEENGINVLSSSLSAYRISLLLGGILNA